VLDLALTPRSALDRVLVPGHYGAENDAPGVIVSEQSGAALASVMARKGKIAELCARVKERHDIDLPMTPRVSAKDGTRFIWAGLGRWLVTAPNEAPSAFERNLRETLAGLASVSNQSDGRAIIRVSGLRARDALAKGVPIDLDPRVFGPDDTAMTVAAHINIHFWQNDPIPTYDIAVFRSLAASFCEWLLDAAAEFAVEITDPHSPKIG
jgi:sarcosine oxidase subunit gamma